MSGGDDVTLTLQYYYLLYFFNKTIADTELEYVSKTLDIHRICLNTTSLTSLDHNTILFHFFAVHTTTHYMNIYHLIVPPAQSHLLS